MSSFMTVLIPGLSQALAGNLRKGGTIFLLAVFLGAATGGLGWLLCGLWSLVDSRSATPAPAAPAAPAAAGKSGGLAPWAFKFAVLGVGSAIALYSISQGRALQSLRFLGIELSFESSLGGRTAEVGGGGGGDTAPVAQADLGGGVAANALREIVAEKGSAAEPDARPPASYAATDVSGTWRNVDGATYEISRTGSTVQIREMSILFFLPVETAACQGTVADGTIQAQCVIGVTGTNGVLELSVAEDGTALVGGYRDLVTGAQVPLTLYR